MIVIGVVKLSNISGVHKCAQRSCLRAFLLLLLVLRSLGLYLWSLQGYGSGPYHIAVI